MSETLPVQSPKSEQAIANMFDRIADRYDFLNGLLSAKQDQRWRQKLVATMPVVSGGGGHHLDVATGTGDVLIAALQGRTDYRTFTGVDISREMLALAGKKVARIPAAQAGNSQGRSVSFAQQSATDLSVDAESVDCVSISFGLRNVVDRLKALQEFHRVLKPGGRLLVLEFFLPKTGIMARLFQFYFHHILPVIGGIFSDKKAYKYLPESVGSFPTPGAFRKILEDVGFEVAAEKSFLFGACRLVSADKK